MTQVAHILLTYFISARLYVSKLWRKQGSFKNFENKLRAIAHRCVIAHRDFATAV